MSDHAVHHRHGSHSSGHDGATMHAPSVRASEDYRNAYAAARPDVGRGVISIDLEAREVEWAIAPGVTIRAWTYNSQLPGPTIEGKIGDVLEVRFKNSLPEATTIHWHGLRVPAPMDGTDTVQNPVGPGESFTYRFRLPDAGTFWYHPHINETIQIERGLYGVLIVRGEDEPVLDGEKVLVFDDMNLNPAGDLAQSRAIERRHGVREEDARLVNGECEPNLEISAGQVERWRILNASSGRCVRLSIGGAVFRLLGTDGGLLEAPVDSREVLLAPSDRVDIAVGPFEEGEELAIESLAYQRNAIKRRSTDRFATLRVGPSRSSAAVIPERFRIITPLASVSSTPTRTVDFGVRYNAGGGMDFVVNGVTHFQDAPVRAGEVQVWDVVNSSLMDHPFHLHGFFFQVLAVNGRPPDWLSWEDVINLPPESTTRIAWMPDDRPGRWMYHCHILDHHAAGMMAHFDVVR